MSLFFRAGVVWLAAMTAARPAEAQAPALAAAREHYREARYEQALDVLAGLDADAGEAVAPDADRLRALCLLAVGRDDEAERVIARVVLADPMAPLPEASPRVRHAFREVRDRTLPAWAETEYEAGKAAFEARDFRSAVQRFNAVLPVLEALAVEGRRDMEARRVLARDFLALSRRLLPPPAPAMPPLAARHPELARSAPAMPAVAPALTVPPVALRQDLPPWPYALGTHATFRGAIDVVIDADGQVIDATIVNAVHPRYDPELLRAARTWHYEPARRNGRPVAAVKRVVVDVHAR